MGPGALAQVLRPLTIQTVPAELLVGINAADDAAVYRVNDAQAVISTADFFPPVVDDPYTFGAIAAANALSDVYAMGGQVLMAINLVAWPDNLDYAILSEILQGGADIVARAGAVVAGGLAVTGMVHPEHILIKGGAQPGDILILSKPLGTGLITTAHKREQVDESDLAAAIASMMQLNRGASQALQRPGVYGGVHAVTDITGFGLLGHAWEMASQSLAGMRFEYDALPLLPNARRYAELGCIPGGTRRNAKHFAPHVRCNERLEEADREILWDPQTSGGLFAAIEPALWPEIAALAPEVMFWRIGEVTERVPDEAHVLLEVN